MVSLGRRRQFLSSLDRKLLRDLLHMKGQTLAIALVIACGIAMFVMSLTTLSSLKRTRRTYYDRYRFAHVFVHVKRAPLEVARRAAEIPGVARVSARIVSSVTMDVEGLDEPAVGQLVSVPDRGEAPLNAVYLRQGRMIEPGGDGEVIAGEAFAEAHGIKPGYRLSAVINGRRQVLTVVGIGLSPEFIFVASPGSWLPDDKRFGVFWMGVSEMEAAFDMEGAFNDLAVQLMTGASDRKVIEELDEIVKPYGGLGTYGRDEHVSHRYLDDEIKQLRGMAVIIPAVFLGVAAFLLNVVLSRLISTQREQIAALKAFGYFRWEVGLHYLKLALAVVMVGVGLGCPFGLWLGKGLTHMYSLFYRLPAYDYRIEAGPLFLAVIISAVAGAAGVLAAVRRAVNLPPAEAMRPEPPTTYRKTVVDRIGMARMVSASGHMILRHLVRRPGRALLSILGMALAASVLVLGSFGEDAMDHIMEFQFDRAQRQDVTLAFVEPSSHAALYEIRRMRGVVSAEPFRAVPVRLRHGHHARKLAITGLPASGTLFRVLDEDAREVPMPKEGVVVSAKLAEILDVRVGDELIVDVLEGRRRTLRLPLAGVFRSFMGLAAYMSMESLNGIMGEGDAVSGAYVSVDEKESGDLYKRLKAVPRIASVNVKDAALKAFKETFAENLLQMRFFNILFSGIIAFGVVYNSARISLSERSRSLATMRVIGFTRGEILAIFLGEFGLLAAIAVPVGLFMGYLFALMLEPAMNTEMYSVPVVIDRGTYVFAALTTSTAAILSGLAVRRRLNRLDLIAVLKSRD